MANSCPGLGDTLSAFLDGELEPAEAHAVTHHLVACRRCSSELEGLRQVRRFVAPGSPLAPAVPSGLHEKVRANLYRREERVKLRPRIPELRGFRLWAAASALVLVFLGVALLAGALGAEWLSPSPAAAAARASLEDHRLCEQLGRVPQSLHGDAAQVRAQLSGAVGMSIATLQGIPGGFSFAGGRAFRADEVTAAHLAWLEHGQMLSFYQAADPGGGVPADWRLVLLDHREFWISASEQERAVFWRSGGVIYLLAGDLSETDLLRLALSVNTSHAPTD